MGRLFWKLFLSFWLAMTLSLTAGISYLEVSGHPDAATSRERGWAGLMLRTAEQVLATTGVGPAAALIAEWSGDPVAPRIALLGKRGQLLAGEELPDAATRRTVAAADGQFYTLLSRVAAIDRPPPPPTLAVPIVSGAVISLLFSSFLAWYLSRPLHHLRWALHSVALGNFATRVGPRMGTRRDEIVDLGRDVDRMADRLQRLVETRQRLLHDLSHELRSPLTRMQAAIGLLRQTPARAPDMLERIEREAERLDGMVGELLTLARLEVGGGVIVRERVDLIELLGAIVEDAAFEAQACGRSVRMASQGRFVATVAGEVLCRAFENIIRNAVKFTAPETAVEVTATVGPEQRWLRVEVEDHGPGVPVDMLDRIFEPFLRLESARPESTSSSAGFGLGLAIARRAIESHGGAVVAALAHHGGLRVTITLPAQRDRSAVQADAA
ncbi:ATP-binding protein [Azospirillum sp. ST 5-10]|uniref:ATP-binding protein n=1 Tax=unclassified Azospirillum TaxID=2630922 RepID=UPI003F4A69F8